MACAYASDSRRFSLSRGFKSLGLCALVLVCAASADLAAAQQDPTPDSHIATLTVQTNLVQIPVLVLTKDHERINGPIDASRFSVRLGKGRWARPKYVRREGEDPIDLAIVIDSRNPQRDVMPRLDQAIAGLAASSLNSRDHVSIYMMGCSAMHAIEDVPVSEGRLRLAVDAALRAEKSSDNSSCNSGNKLWDALAYVVRALSTQPGRRTVLAVTNGDDQRSRHTSETLAELAQLSGVTVFGLNPVFHSSSAFSLQSQGEQLLSDMTESSGGITLNLESQSVNKELVKFVQILRDRYIVEFRRPDDVPAGKVELAVSVIGPNLFVRTAGKGVPAADIKDADYTIQLAEVEESASPAATAVASSTQTPQPVSPAATPNVSATAAAPVANQATEQQETSLPPVPMTSTLTVSTRLTVEDVTVTNTKRVPVRGLERADFELKEDGKVQTIKNFEENGAPANAATAITLSPSSGAPLYASVATNILLLDAVTTGLSRGLAMPQDSFAYARQQSLRYLKNLPAGTPVAILQLGSNLRVLQDVTSDKAQLVAAVGAASYQQVVGTYVAVRSPGAACDAANAQSQKVVDALDGLADYLSGIKGRKNVIWFTPGTPWLTQYQQFSMVNCLRDYTAQLDKVYLQLSSARVALYPIDPRGLFTDPSQSAAAQPMITTGPMGTAGVSLPNPTATVQQAGAFGGSVQNDHSSLAQMAEATGGTPYFNRNDLDAALGEAIAIGADYYSLAYVPPLSGYDGKFHSISVHVDKPNAQLEYRRGYVSIDPAKVPDAPQAKH